MNWWKLIIGIVLFLMAIALYKYLFKIPFKNINRDEFIKNRTGYISQETSDMVDDLDEWQGKVAVIVMGLFGLYLVGRELYAFLGY